MNRGLRSGATVNLWLGALTLGLLLLGSGITLALLAKLIAGAGVLAGGVVLLLLAVWQLKGSSLRLTLSLVEGHSPGQMLVTRQPRRGLPDVVVFSGHMGLLIVLNALQDLIGRGLAVPPPGGDFRAIARLIAMSHSEARVISATAENVRLCASLKNGEVVSGSAELERSLSAPIRNLFLSSDGATPAPTESWPVSKELEEGISTADMIVFGPGSFYTSVIPSLLVERVRQSVAASKAPAIFVCSIMTEPGRTDGWSVTDFIRHFSELAGVPPHYTIVNRSYPGSGILSRYEVTGSYPVMVTPEEHMDASKVVLGSSFPGSTTLTIGGSTVIESDIIEVITENRMTVDPEDGATSEHTVSVIRHDPKKLGRVFRNIISQTRARALAG